MAKHKIKPKGNKLRAVKLICRSTAVIFALLIVVLTATGWMLRDAQTGYAGLSFQSIVQIFTLSIIIGGFNTVLTSDLVFKKSMLLWRVILMMFIGGAACFISAVVFRWFPPDMREVWIAFGVLFLVVFGVVSLGMVIKTKREDRRCNIAFSEYKSKFRRETI